MVVAVVGMEDGTWASATGRKARVGFGGDFADAEVLFVVERARATAGETEVRDRCPGDRCLGGSHRLTGAAWSTDDSE